MICFSRLTLGWPVCCATAVETSNKPIDANLKSLRNMTYLFVRNDLFGCAERLCLSVNHKTFRRRYTSPQAGRDARAPLSFNPISDKNIRIALLRVVAIRSEHQFLSVRREHRETVKRVVVSDALQCGAVRLNHVEIEIASLWMGIVRSEDDSFAVGNVIMCRD